MSQSEKPSEVVPVRSFRLEDKYIKVAARIGEGNATEGMRIALQIAAEELGVAGMLKDKEKSPGR